MTRADIQVYCHSEMKELLGSEADAQGVPLSEWVVRILAKHLKRKDLSQPPRAKLGRPRKTTSNGHGPMFT